MILAFGPRKTVKTGTKIKMADPMPTGPVGYGTTTVKLLQSTKTISCFIDKSIVLYNNAIIELFVRLLLVKFTFCKHFARNSMDQYMYSLGCELTG